MTSTALIVGAAGQDGRLLSEFLLRKNYRVVGVVRPGAAARTEATPGTDLEEADITDASALARVLGDVDPDEVYNLAAISAVGESWRLVHEVMHVNAVGAAALLEETRRAQDAAGHRIAFYQASSSEMFGRPDHSPQNEDTPFRPRSPYGVSKCAAHYLTQNYRASYDMFTACGILYNHESPLRPARFVTRKITCGVAAIALGRSEGLTLGNIEISRDWGYAADYVQAMWLMLQADAPDDFVIATGVSRTLREFLATAFSVCGIDDWERYVHTDPSLFRPTEVDRLVGDATKARTVLGWEPSVTFEQMVTEMVEHDLELLQRDGQAS